LLMGRDRTGRGLTIEGRHAVTIKNLRLREYHHGVYAHRSQKLNIAHCQITSTGELQANTVFLDIWLPVEKAYGGAILLWEVADSEIRENDLQHQMNGVLTYQCQHLQVKNNVANYCSGFGFHLYETSDSHFEDNYADFCCRYEPRGPRRGHMGADSAGFLIVYKSCRNVFRRNCARLGGDGFFLAGLSARYESVGCDGNLFEENDGSYSPNNGFEGTFSRDNIFRNNYANHCNYGFWLGFSRDNLLENNQMIGNTQAGIAVENGFGFKVRGNTFEENTYGILLWSKHLPQFGAAAPQNVTSYDWLIEANRFGHNRTAIRIAADQDHGVRPFDKPGAAPRPHDHTIRNNSFRDNGDDFDLAGAEHTVIEANEQQT
jgi:parallel beta-helix repeat protein